MFIFVLDFVPVFGYSLPMPYGYAPTSRYRWRAARDPEAFHFGPFSPRTEDRYCGMLAFGLLEAAVIYWPVTLGLLALSGLALGLGRLLSRA